MTALLEAVGLSRVFPVRGGGQLRAVDDVSLSIGQHDVLGVVGESGCGKSTLGRMLAGILPASGGDVRFEGVALGALAPAARRRTRARLQYVYQDPGASLDPRWTIGRALEEPLVAHTSLARAARQAAVRAIIAAVGLPEAFLAAFPHELSGGQQRRIGLARVLTLRPALVILDEPTAGLDVSVQATILRLFRDMAAQFGLTYVFISHDLAVVEAFCSHVAVMYLGRIVEQGPADTVFAAPQHPYTRSLLDAVPTPGGRRVREAAWLEGEVPDPVARPGGCSFRPRCPLARDVCAAAPPPLLPTRHAGHHAACLFAPDLLDG